MDVKYAFSFTDRGTFFKVSRLNGMSLIQLFKYIKFIHTLGFEGSTVNGATICGGFTQLTLPMHSTEPFFSLSKIVSVTKEVNFLHLFELLKLLGGGKS